MTVDFAQFKARSKANSEIEKIQSKLKEMSSFQKEEDDRYWRPTLDDSGNGSALIRFLPAGEIRNSETADHIPWVRMWRHAFQNKKNNQWYIENCRSTLGPEEKDPVMEYNSVLWASGDKAKQNFVSANTKRKLTYISNILVLKDPKKPENEGKVFLFAYGQRIFNKIQNKLTPSDELSTPVDVFNMWTGASFKLIVKKVDGFPNYDSSEWLPSEELYNGADSKIKDVLERCHLLSPEISPDKFKSYDDLKKRFYKVMGFDKGENLVVEKPVARQEVEKAPWETSSASEPTSNVVDEDDEDLATLRALADE